MKNPWLDKNDDSNKKRQLLDLAKYGKSNFSYDPEFTKFLKNNKPKWFK